MIHDPDRARNNERRDADHEKKYGHIPIGFLIVAKLEEEGQEDPSLANRDGSDCKVRAHLGEKMPCGGKIGRECQDEASGKSDDV
jgi:hypothetical protein